MPSHKMPTAGQFAKALGELRRPGGRVLAMIQAHHRATGRALNAETLAKRVGYAGFRAVNLQYGLFASKLGHAMGIKDAGLDLVADLIRPKQVTNKEWILVMKTNFAAGLEEAKWIR